MLLIARAFTVLCLVTVSALHHVQFPGLQLLGPKPEYTKEQAGRCLKFIHNPRTGGTSVDSLNLHLPKGQRAFDTIMEAYLDRAAGSFLFPNEAPGHLFDVAHGTELSDEAAANAALHYGPYLLAFDFRWVNFESKMTGLRETCQDLHAPPQYDERVMRWLAEPGCTSFCTVRDPMSRLLSAYKFRHFGECSLDGFEHWILSTFPLRKSVAFCHVYPQLEYVNSSDTKDGGKRFCDRTLRFEHLAEDFNALMDEFQKPLRMTTHILGTATCHIDVAGLSTEAKSRVYNQYKADYDAFGYAPPPGL